MLPKEFADLEPFAEWCIASEHDRFAKRLASSMDEIQALGLPQVTFYLAVGFFFAGTLYPVVRGVALNPGTPVAAVEPTLPVFSLSTTT